MITTLPKLNTMTTLRHLLLFSTIFSPALSSAINLPLPRQALSDSSETTTTTTTTSTAPTGPPGIILTPPDIPEWSPITESSNESTDFSPASSDPPTFEPTSTSSFEPSGTLPGNLFPIIISSSSISSLRPCTTTLTSTASSHSRPCPPPEWDGTLTSWPSTTTLFKPINCNGCMYVSVTKDWAVGCPNQHVSATVLVATPSTTWTEVCEGVGGAVATTSGASGVAGGSGAGAGAGLVVTTCRPPVGPVGGGGGGGGEPPAMPTFTSGGSSSGEEVTLGAKRGKRDVET